MDIGECFLTQQEGKRASFMDRNFVPKALEVLHHQSQNFADCRGVGRIEWFKGAEFLNHDRTFVGEFPETCFSS